MKIKCTLQKVALKYREARAAQAGGMAVLQWLTAT